MGRKKKTETEDTAQPVPKVRKATSGPLRDKSRTMARMIAAVGKVIQKKGYLSGAFIISHCMRNRTEVCFAVSTLTKKRGENG
ncbi:hypothetical protein ACTS9C_02370 [Empedobacter brevis]